MKVVVFTNMKYFVNLQKSFHSFDSPYTCGNIQIRPFVGLKQLISPKN
jgi:energy-coupling factor transporter ATP-binding protein EcfA2